MATIVTQHPEALGLRVYAHASPHEKMQTHMDYTSKQEWLHKYEYNLKRAFKYLTQWKSHSGTLHPTPNTLSNAPSKSESRDKIVAKSQGEKMGVSHSTSTGAPDEQTGGKMPFLPLEVHIEILKHLGWNEQVRLAGVCKTWRSVIIEWIIPTEFIGLDTKPSRYIINPLFSQLEFELGSSVLQCDMFLTDDGSLLIDQPLCWPPTTQLAVRVSDLRADGLEPGVDGVINVTTSRCCDRSLRIRDLLASLDRFYRQVNEDRAIVDESSWSSWKFKLQTNKWWRRGYLTLHGNWEWKDGGRYLCLYAKKVAVGWEFDDD